MKHWFVGCSGFSYKHWKGQFYPERLSQKKWFEHYCEQFNTVELNVTFYRVPKLEVFTGWYDRSPDEFLFTVKAPRLITHFKKFRSTSDDIRRFYDIVNVGLKEKLGPILFQLHPNYRYNEENLEALLREMDTNFLNIIEFRHESWWNPKVLKGMRAAGISFCGISYPGLPEEVIKTSETLYYRFHGVPELYRSPYTNTELASVVSQIKLQRGIDKIFIYFNNDIDVHAISNAKVVQSLSGAKRNLHSAKKLK